MVLGDNMTMAQAEQQSPLATSEPEQSEARKMLLGVFGINRLRDRITKAEEELAAAEVSITQKRAEVEDLHQQWRDAGLLGR